MMILHGDDLIPEEVESLKKDSRILDGLSFYSSGKYFESHESWEKAWVLEKDIIQKTLLKVLIQLAGVCVLIQKKRVTSAERLFNALKGHLAGILPLPGVDSKAVYSVGNVADIVGSMQMQNFVSQVVSGLRLKNEVRRFSSKSMSKSIMILVVEDVAKMRELIMQGLTSLDKQIDDYEVPEVRVKGVGLVLEARGLVQVHRPDVVFLDEVLPGESLQGNLEYFHENNIPVVLMTSMKDPLKVTDEQRVLGVLAKLKKPANYDFAPLYKLLIKVLKSLKF